LSEVKDGFKLSFQRLIEGSFLSNGIIPYFDCGGSYMSRHSLKLHNKINYFFITQFKKLKIRNEAYGVRLAKDHCSRTSTTNCVVSL
jgi:hypothetical protein